MEKKVILDEIESLRFSIQMNELRTYSDGEAYKRDSERLDELKKKLKEIETLEKDKSGGVDEMIRYDIDALEYIAKIADGGMRDAITLMDKCLSFSSDLTVENVIKALGVTDYNTMFDLNNAFFENDKTKLIKIVSDVYSSGMDLKLFIKNYFEFLLDLNVYCLTKDLAMTKIPEIWVDEMKSYGSHEWSVSNNLLTYITDLQSSIKWEQNPKAVIIAKFILFEED